MKNSLLRGFTLFCLGFSLFTLSACAEETEVEVPMTEPMEEEILTEEPMMEEPMIVDSSAVDSMVADSMIMEDGL